jgi:hypothetical protein
MTPEEFWKIWEQSEPTPKPVFFRLYYNETTGRPIEYSMEDLPGKYIDITPEQFRLANFRIKVVNDQIVEIPLFVPSKLVPSNHGTPCHINDVSVVVDNNTPHQTWALQDEKD